MFDERIEQLWHEKIGRRRKLPKLVGRDCAGRAVGMRRAKYNFVVGERETLGAGERNCSGSGGSVHSDYVAGKIADGVAVWILDVKRAGVGRLQLANGGHHVAGVFFDFFERPVRNAAGAVIVA
jgi:hypothetical protein